MSRREESLTIYNSEIGSNSLFQTPDKIISERKKPSLAVTLILILTAISFYSVGIHESSKIVMDIVEAVAKEACDDYQF